MRARRSSPEGAPRASRLKRWLVSAVVLLLGRRRRKRGEPLDRERVVPGGPAEPRAELLAIGFLAASALCGVAFIAFYALDRLPKQTQLLGGALGLSFLFLGAAFVVASKRLVVGQQVEHDYPADEHPDEQETLVALVEESGSRLTRRRLFKLALAGAGGALGAALVVPAASLGPLLDIDPFYRTPWRRGRRLVDVDDKPYRADDIEQDALYTAFPEGADKEALASPVVLVRLAPRAFRLPSAIAHFPAQGIVAYSKVCTHAACAISLYRAPLFAADEPGPALVCPCHYSTFDPAKGGTVEFGPAGRKLPMLPLRIDRHGFLRAGGTFDEPVGPSWWGVRMRKAKP
jgi:quinol---cytochrome c reductase iron-sulfur subunit